jgi:poly(beta-D-mannuronate) lyase
MPTETLVSNPTALRNAIATAKAGDLILMKNGVWPDLTIDFEAKGPVMLRAETPGAVHLTGVSKLRVKGEGLAVEGLYFHDGSSPEAVIAIRGQGNRLTGCAVVDFNGPDKAKDTKWISLYGERHELDHCYFAGKTNQGTTLVVWLPKPDTGPNGHHIHHNHFGPRPPLGANGGETIRVGDSSTSMQSSKTLVEYNYFHHCDGEVEIISNKSCDNIYRRNTFDACDGTLTLRHGNSCTVEANLFLGRNYKRAGGVRIIGEDHLVQGNEFDSLPGTGARAAISMMQGIPNSPLNGYFQVKRARITNNLTRNCAEAFNGSVAGKDTSLPPLDVVLLNNNFTNKATLKLAALDARQTGPEWMQR